MHRIVAVFLVVLVALCAPGIPIAAQQPAASTALEIVSPRPGTTVGGVVSIIGTVQVDGLQSYTIAFGAGPAPERWIPIGEPRLDPVADGRLALWDTTRIPDGDYMLRLRALLPAKDGARYADATIGLIAVSNAPRTLTPSPTAAPTATPTPTLTPTPTPTPGPTLDVADGSSPYLYVNMMEQFDPLCEGWQQRYSIWVSNVGAIELTNVAITNVLPLGLQPVLERSTEGATQEDDLRVTWFLESLAPGEAVKFELQAAVASWLTPGEWLQNRVEVSSDQVAPVVKTKDSLHSACEWLQQTPTVVPVIRATPVPAAGANTTPAVAAPTPVPTWTPVTFVVDPDTVESSLDLLTIVIAAALGVLLVVTGLLVYRQVGRRR